MEEPVKHELRIIMIVWILVLAALSIGSLPAVLFFYYYWRFNNPIKFVFIVPFSIFSFIVFFVITTIILCLFAVLINRHNSRKSISREKLWKKEAFRLHFNEFFMFYSMLMQPGRLKNWIARCFGMKLGKNVKLCKETRIYNPDYVEIGNSTLIGSKSLLSAHLEERGIYNLEKISIGKNCLIGGGTWILPGVEIGDNVKVAARALIPKNKKLPSNSVWAGVPVKRLK